MEKDWANRNTDERRRLRCWLVQLSWPSWSASQTSPLSLTPIVLTQGGSLAGEVNCPTSSSISSISSSAMSTSASSFTTRTVAAAMAAVASGHSDPEGESPRKLTEWLQDRSLGRNLSFRTIPLLGWGVTVEGRKEEMLFCGPILLSALDSLEWDEIYH